MLDYLRISSTPASPRSTSAAPPPSIRPAHRRHRRPHRGHRLHPGWHPRERLQRHQHLDQPVDTARNRSTPSGVAADLGISGPRPRTHLIRELLAWLGGFMPGRAARPVATPRAAIRPWGTRARVQPRRRRGCRGRRRSTVRVRLWVGRGRPRVCALPVRPPCVPAGRWPGFVGHVGCPEFVVASSSTMVAAAMITSPSLTGVLFRRVSP